MDGRSEPISGCDAPGSRAGVSSALYPVKYPTTSATTSVLPVLL
jgi:hypothetical protein